MVFSRIVIILHQFTSSAATIRVPFHVLIALFFTLIHVGFVGACSAKSVGSSLFLYWRKDIHSFKVLNCFWLCFIDNQCQFCLTEVDGFWLTELLVLYFWKNYVLYWCLIRQRKLAAVQDALQTHRVESFLHTEHSFSKSIPILAPWRWICLFYIGTNVALQTCHIANTSCKVR